MFNYDSALGTNVRAHLISKGIEKPLASNVYQLTEKERIAQIEHYLNQINAVMGVNVNNHTLAKTIYDDYSGQSYKKFPKNPHGFVKTSNQYDDYLIITREYKCPTTWQKKEFFLTLEWTNLVYEIDSTYLSTVIEFFLHRPYDEQLFKSCLIETIKFLYETDITVTIEYE